MDFVHIALLGLSYRTAPIAIREQLSCSIADLPIHLLANDCRFKTVQEVVVISTCNRIELYAALNREDGNTQTMLTELLSEMTGVETAVYTQNTYFHINQAAAAHLLRVAAGLDSLVLGEPQILGQVTNAYMSATDTKTIGPVLTELFRTAIRTGKRVRTETNISQNPMSTSSMAIAQAQKLLGDLTHHNHLVIGLGEMGRLALKRLRNRGATRISVANRTYERAAKLATQYGFTPFKLDALTDALAAADVVVSATSAVKQVITTDMVQSIMMDRPERPLILIDIAVPRDIDPAVANIPGVHLFDADGLQGDLDKAFADRQREVPKVEQIIDNEVNTLTVQLRTLTIKPVIVNLREKAEFIRQQELDRTLRHLGEVDPQTLKHLQHFSRSLINKLLHEPTVRLKASAGDNDAAGYATAINELFGLINEN
jgi:glutamyl-tRNA reductase